MQQYRMLIGGEWKTAAQGAVFDAQNPLPTPFVMK